MSYSPYAPNAQGLTEALLDLKSNFPGQVANKINGFAANAFENLNQGDAVFSRASDGQLGRAIANDTQDKARVVGFVETTVTAGSLVRCIVEGVTPVSGLDAGDHYFLSASSAGAIVKTPPSSSGHFVTRVGEAASSASLVVKTEPPIEIV
tara:strand:+ start:745 stop:1197 length:453 start_codon:yes stop_codon:yes gene_type:complete